MVIQRQKLTRLRWKSKLPETNFMNAHVIAWMNSKAFRVGAFGTRRAQILLIDRYKAELNYADRMHGK
jgi:hypothetical protein